MTMTRAYLWHEGPQGRKDVFVIHLRTYVISPIDTQISSVWSVNDRQEVLI